MFHIAQINLNFYLTIKKEDAYNYFFNELGKDLPEEVWRVSMIAKISGYVNQPRKFLLSDKVIEKFEPNAKVDVFTALINLAGINQINIKQNAFRSMIELFAVILQSKDLKIEMSANETLIKDLFKLLIQNWEFPIKGFGNFIEDLFNRYLSSVNPDTVISGKNIYDEILHRIESMEFKQTKRRYSSLKVLLNYVPTDKILNKTPDLLGELLSYQNIVSETTCVMLFGELLEKRLKELTKENPKDKEGNVIKWINFWFPTYLKTLNQCSLKTTKIIVEYFHPHIYRRCLECLPEIVRRMQAVENKTKNHIFSIVGILKIARQYGWLVPNKDQTDYLVSNKFDKPIAKNKPGKDSGENMIQQTGLVNFLEDMITNEDRHIVLSAFRTIVDPQKDSLPITQFEFRLVKKFLLYNIKNKFPDFRNDTSNALKKFIHRCRNVFNSDIVLIDQDPENLAKICEKSQNFKNFFTFMNDVYSIFIIMVYPESPYESTHPLLEL